jgi:hypothetical protein
MDTIAEDDLLTTAEAAVILGVDRSGVIRRVKAGDLVPARTLPGRTGSHLYHRSDVEALRDDIA